MSLDLFDMYFIIFARFVVFSYAYRLFPFYRKPKHLALLEPSSAESDVPRKSLVHGKLMKRLLSGQGRHVFVTQADLGHPTQVQTFLFSLGGSAPRHPEIVGLRHP